MGNNVSNTISNDKTNISSGCSSPKNDVPNREVKKEYNGGIRLSDLFTTEQIQTIDHHAKTTEENFEKSSPY